MQRAIASAERLLICTVRSPDLDNSGLVQIYGSVYVHRVVALVGIISTLRLSICLVDLPNLDKFMSRCRVKMTQIDILSF